MIESSHGIHGKPRTTVEIITAILDAVKHLGRGGATDEQVKKYALLSSTLWMRYCTMAMRCGLLKVNESQTSRIVLTKRGVEFLETCGDLTTFSKPVAVSA